MALRLQEEHGFSLVELMVAMIIMGVVGTATLGVVTAALRSQRFASEVRDEVEGVRVGMDRLRKEVRSTRQVRTGSTARQLNLWLDRNQNHVPDAGELVTYLINDVGGGSADLRRWNDVQGQGGAVVVARGLQLADAFVYDLAPQDTRTVTITLTAISDSPQGPSPLTTTSIVRVRNV